MIRVFHLEDSILLIGKETTQILPIPEFEQAETVAAFAKRMRVFVDYVEEVAKKMDD